MTVKEFQEYRHFKNKKKYDFICITLPKEDAPVGVLMTTQKVFHTETETWITMYNWNRISFTDLDEYLVIYQSEDDKNAEHLYARPVDMFFEHVKDGNNFVKRFKPL